MPVTHERQRGSQQMLEKRQQQRRPTYRVVVVEYRQRRRQVCLSVNSPPVWATAVPGRVTTASLLRPFDCHTLIALVTDCC